MEKLYEQNSFLTQFSAVVTNCVQGKKGWDICLTQTAFYPEGGGQPYDIGTLGGVKVLEEKNRKKAQMLYDYIDGSKLYTAPVAKEDRSLMNVVFVTGDEALDKKFVAEAKAAGLVNLGGHRSIGGMRASIYNAMPMEGVEALIAFMKKFEEENAK